MGYKDDLGNPPLLVVSDLERIEIHTNFAGLSPMVKLVTLDDLAADDPSAALQLLRDLFTAPRSSARGSSPPRSPNWRRAISRRSPRASARAATIPSPSPTSWTASCSACSRRTRGSCRRASSATIFLIDEPEISLNVKWQRVLVDTLLGLVRGTNVEFILATHSLELLASQREHVYRLESKRA